MNRKKAIIAIGGNSLIKAGEKGTIAEQLANAQATAKSIIDVLRAGYAVVITHGNGPQVGAALLRSERAADQVYELPLDVCVAATQGEIGYILQSSLEQELARSGMNIPVVTMLTQVEIDPCDAAFESPTKPIGPFYSKDIARAKEKMFGWNVVEDAARGYRRVVASPEPKTIIEKDAILQCLEMGMLVIALGGGGIPVIKTEGGVRGCEAVIDKDKSSSLLASEIDAELLVISTDANNVFVGYKTPSQRALGEVTVEEMQTHFDHGEFPAGSMGPKIESGIRFIRKGGKRVIITSYDLIHDALQGNAGTQIVPSNAHHPKEKEEHS